MTSICQTLLFCMLGFIFELWLHQSVNTHVRQTTRILYRGNIELNMNAKSLFFFFFFFVNTIFCVDYIFFPQKIYLEFKHK